MAGERAGADRGGVAASAMLPPAAGPFAGVRVLELCCGIAGPLAGMLLADLGADVVKGELDPGDPLRGLPAFHVLNRSKSSAAVAAEETARLALRADVVLIDREIAAAHRGTLDAPALTARSPGLIHCTVSGFGEAGSLADL